MIDIKKISSEDLLRELIDRRVLDTHTYFTINEKKKEVREILKLIEKHVEEAMNQSSFDKEEWGEKDERTQWNYCSC